MLEYSSAQTLRHPLFITGILGILLSFVWLYAIYDSPDQHPALSEKERMIFQEEGSNVQLASAALVRIYNTLRLTTKIDCQTFNRCFLFKGKEHTMEKYSDVTSGLGITTCQFHAVLGICHDGNGDTSVFCRRLQT